MPLTADRANAASPVSFPSPPDNTQAPVWTGRAFRMGDRETRVLSYEVGQSGWTDELTAFQEGTAGKDHYIDRASRRHTLNQLRHWLTTDSPVILEVGCSSGFVLPLLRDAFPHGVILGADYVRGPLDALAQALCDMPLLQFDITRCPLPDGCVDAVVLLNVLEHIEDDQTALSHVARILKPGGIAVIEVPAGPKLYGVYDRLLLHYRRYRMSQLLEQVSRAGLRTLYKSHLGFFLYPAFWAVKKQERRYSNCTEEVRKAIVSRNITTAGSHPLMHRLMAAEAALRTWLYYPFGIRCLLTCQRLP